MPGAGRASDPIAAPCVSILCGAETHGGVPPPLWTLFEATERTMRPEESTVTTRKCRALTKQLAVPRASEGSRTRSGALLTTSEAPRTRFGPPPRPATAVANLPRTQPQVLAASAPIPTGRTTSQRPRTPSGLVASLPATLRRLPPYREPESATSDASFPGQALRSHMTSITVPSARFTSPVRILISSSGVAR